MRDQILRGALFLCLLAFAGTALDPYPSPRLFAETVVFLVSFFCFVYGFAAACVRTIALGRFQYRGWRAVVVGLGISAAGLALTCLVALIPEPNRNGPPRRRATLPIYWVLPAAPQPTQPPAGNWRFQVGANHGNGAWFVHTSEAGRPLSVR